MTTTRKKTMRPRGVGFQWEPIAPDARTMRGRFGHVSLTAPTIGTTEAEHKLARVWYDRALAPLARLADRHHALGHPGAVDVATAAMAAAAREIFIPRPTPEATIAVVGAIRADAEARIAALCAPKPPAPMTVNVTPAPVTVTVEGASGTRTIQHLRDTEGRLVSSVVTDGPAPAAGGAS